MSRGIESLSVRELVNYGVEMSEITLELMAKIIEIADRYDLGREVAVRSFSESLNKTVLNFSFQNFEREVNDGE